jgi:N-acyl amino acid synthase of PEP-CTERM/exosortase system
VQQIVSTLATSTAEASASLIGLYRRYFEYRLARDAQDRRATFALRYLVYCEETGFLSKDANPQGLERDAHDAHALHSLLLHRQSGFVAGTVRIVLPRPMEPGCAQPARLFSTALDKLDPALLPRARTGEISRFSIHPSFRRRLGDGLYAQIFDGGDSDTDPRRVIPHITLGLMASLFAMVEEARLTHLCAIIDPALLRMLARLGLHFEKAGPPIDFHGSRQPVYASTSLLLEQLADERPDIHAFIVERCETA